jgi:hypothetical protein
MEAPQKYRKLAAKLAQELWIADSVDACRDVERMVEKCEGLATQLEELPPTSDREAPKREP